MVGRMLIAAAAALTLAGMAAPAAAQALDDRYWLEVSAYRPSIDTSLAISRPGSPGTDVDLENDLGLSDSDTLPAVYAGARLWDRWTITAEYYALNRDASRTLTRDIVFDGVTYPATAQVDSELKSDVYRLTVGYAFWRSDRAEVGAAIGLHATSFDVGLRSNFSAGGGGATTTTARSEDFLAPLPTVGLYGTYQATPKITLAGRVDYLSLTVGDYSGSLLNAQASASYAVTSNIALGAAYRYVAYDLDVEKPNYTATLDYNFSGPSVFVRFGFR
jgi:opacity protein-like surface antigen